MELYSCDTMVALGNSTESGHVIFAKNSDRPVTEAQPLVVYPAADHAPDETVECTYIQIPQAAHTYRVLGSKPYWIWGFEHGMNEKGVAIGNEAVWSREPEEAENGLLGMDLLRLGLERGATAYEALHVITSLLEKYGQGGNAAVGMQHRYHNAFLIADAREAWILDTCSRRWVARRVRDVAGISNCYSTETEWDEDSGDVKEHAYEMGWISPQVPFNFAKAYGAMSLKHRAAQPRFFRLNKLLRANMGHITLDTIRAIQRDHFEGESIAPRWSPADGLQVTICMHAMLDTASKTAASSHVELVEGETPVWWSAFGCPCLSVYAPYSVNNALPAELSCAEAKYTPESAWWQFERLQYAIEQDYPRYAPQWQEVAARLETQLREQAASGKAPDDAAVEANTRMILDAVNAMYTRIIGEQAPSAQPQHTGMNETAKRRAGITF
ncbi:MAG: C69 family dipeptidase [Gemmiger sp.]|uniref:Dipeptidase n=1 Tax=Subdoligranulum variabile TaxID=214851 RepID=A0A921LNX9_9FIRM|nr:C69 family dipeptidase [Gemmiger sp.]MEE0709026.1 C69 family dipeptidase [Gemmiger sp.]HJG28212.1 C69 family dipeptidase [Subdoligranulum variabile]